MTLADLEIGQSGKVINILGNDSNRQHLIDMGIIPNTIIKLHKLAPLGDPMEFRLRGYSLSLRKEDAKRIDVEIVEEEIETFKKKKLHSLHPGLGEKGIKYHDSKNEKPLDNNEVLTFALVGNQNAGKTTLFNQLTGSNQHVGNFPGVTVESKDGQIRNRKNTLITDLPGIYSLSPYSPEEIVSRNFILDSKPKGIINVLDATSIERGLYLTMQLLELDIPMVLALNMMDEIDENGGYIDINALEKALGIPVVAISAYKNEGIDELIEHAIHVARYQEKPLIKDYCDVSDHNGIIHRCLHSIMHLIEDHAKASELPIRFAASKAAEGDEDIIERLKLTENEKETIEHIVKQMEDERGLEKAYCIGEMRYSFIYKVCKDNVIKPQESIQQIRSNKIDKILTGKYSAIPSFIAIMLMIFYLTFEIIGPYLQSLIEDLIAILQNNVANLLLNYNINEGLYSLIIDGVFSGVGSVLSFLPIVVTLFLFLSILEDSGYMARVAFFMDKLLRKLGLSGRSIVPLIIGFGCSVPAVMASRTLPSQRDRKMTILLTPFMSCSAKLPIYGFFAQAFFPNYAGLVVTILYFLGVGIGVLIAFLFKKTLFKGEAIPFIMELPSYRMPSLKSVMRLLWDKSKDFLQRAFGIIFVATIVIWFLQHFSLNLQIIENQEESILAFVSNYLCNIFKPLGFADWRITTALITGILAKETVVSTLQVLLPLEQLAQSFSYPAIISLLVFCLLYSPCISTIATIKKELGHLSAIFTLTFTCLVAYIFAYLAFIISNLFI